ncbi:MAG: ABC transporter substrate-binding protein [Oscillospiraceae bacterium]|nr:ABC transporter substrate-binding protein [Oscillospiraceae bacterium]
MKRLTALLLGLVLLLSGCTTVETPYVPTGNALGEEPIQPPTLEKPDMTLSLAYYPERSLNPYTCTDATNRVMLSLVYQGLFTVDRNYQASPMLCQGYQVSRDMRTYVFYVRTDATYSDGTTVTEADVIASLQAAKGSPVYGGRFRHVMSVKQLEGGGIEVALDTPYENLPVLLDIPIVKVSQVEAEKPLGTGPYLLEDTISGQWLRRRTNWWCTSSDLIANVDFIPLTAVDSATKVRDAFESQSVSLVCVDPGSPTYADFRCDYELWDCESGQLLYLAANPQRQVFSNPAIRTALARSIDREALIDTYYRGFGQAAVLPASPYSIHYDHKLAAKYTYDPDALTKAVEAAGLVGEDVLILLNSDDGVRLSVGREIVKIMEKAGLVVNTLELNQEEFLVHVEWYEYDLYLGQTKLTPNMDLSEFFGKDGVLNFNHIEDPALYALSLEALANAGNYYTLHKAVVEDGRLCPILFRDYAIYTQRGLFTQVSAPRDNLFQYTIGVSMDEILLK